MDINYKQDQFELFPGRSEGHAGSQPPHRLIFSSMTLSAENIIILTVLIFLGIIVSFSIGVEKGKRLNLANAATPIRPVAIEQPKTVTPLLKKETVKDIGNVTVAKQGVPGSTSAIQTVPASGSENFYTVQIASFKLRKFAEEEAHGLKAKGYETFIVPKGQHLVVCAGRFLDQAAAKIFLGKLKGKYKDCLVRRL